jgi:uncharacterized protein
VTRNLALSYPLASLLAEPPGSDQVYALAGIKIPLDDGLRLAEPIEGDLRISRTNRGVLVNARIRTVLEDTCARCLGPAIVPLRLKIEEEALPSIDIGTGAALDRISEPDVVRLTDHHELELEPLLREAVELAEPIAPLCEPDCPGLCVECGERLGAGHEAHEAATVDPRFAALQGFQVDADAEKG